MNLMMKRTLGAFLALQAMNIQAGSSNLFHVTTSGVELGQTVSFNLCLTVNGQNPLSCQRYSTSNATLVINTTAAHHTYQYAGIKFNTPGFIYTPQGLRANVLTKLGRETVSAGYTLIGTVSDTHSATGTVSPKGGVAVLSVSITDLALSVSGLTLNGQPSGQARTITIFNTGVAPATGFAISYPTWPTGTTATSNCGATLAVGAQCTITITPGATPTSNCANTGIAPTSGVITISATGVAPVTSNVVVLSYGCIYQSGYLFAMAETADPEESIGGTVVAQTDQAPRYPDGVVWSSNGAGSVSANVSWDVIPGIGVTSTEGSPIPPYMAAQTIFDTTYSNVSTFPFPSSDLFLACNGKTDGACNSANILTLYNTYNTNYGIGDAPYSLAAGPTNLTYYAAGRCSAAINGYFDWYLPAICEMGPADRAPFCAAGTQNIADQLPDLMGDPNSDPDTSCTYGANCLSGYYWSSTEDSTTPEDTNNPQGLAWVQHFTPGGSLSQFANKLYGSGVRCVRALTP